MPPIAARNEALGRTRPERVRAGAQTPATAMPPLPGATRPVGLVPKPSEVEGFVPAQREARALLQIDTRRASITDPRFVEIAMRRLALHTGDALDDIRHAYTLATQLPAALKKNLSLVRGYTVEALGREALAARFPNAHVDYGVEIRAGHDDDTIGELDAVVVRNADGVVLAIAEAKASVEKLDGGVAKVRDHLTRIQGDGVQHYKTRGDERIFHFDDPEGPHHRSTFAGIGHDRCFAIGPREAPEREDFVRVPISEATIWGLAELVVASHREAEQKAAAAAKTTTILALRAA
ncbi:hypothetical protein L6R52_27665 [Myxococcota bacterium]|nr:hypothetical protein [Myxococcota bacterium]